VDEHERAYIIEGALAADISREGAPTTGPIIEGALAVPTYHTEGAPTAGPIIEGALAADISREGAPTAGPIIEGALAADISREGAPTAGPVMEGPPTAARMEISACH
jgi:hypothetical protein